MRAGGGGALKKIVLWNTRLSKNVLMPWKDRMAGAVRAQAHIKKVWVSYRYQKKEEAFGQVAGN